MLTTEELIEEYIKEAKKQVLEWYTPNTTRQFIETSLWSGSLQDEENTGSQTKLIILEGGEAKGTVLADYFNGVVIAYDRTFSQFRIWKTR